MSLTSYELFNIWFPALVGALVIGLVVAALWDCIRRRFWIFVSRFCPCILGEVGLDNGCLSREKVRARRREKNKKLEKVLRVATRMNLLKPRKLSNSGATDAFDIEAQTGINAHHAATETSAVEGTCPGETIQGVDCEPVNIYYLAYFPTGTSKKVIRHAKRLFHRLAKERVKEMKSSVILQASIAIDPWVLAEIVELARHCMQKENRCIFQLGNWAILYYNGGDVQLHLLKEGDVPVNVEARWRPGKTGITMRGLHLTGSQVKVGTKRTSKILQSAGPATQGGGDLDELHLPVKEFEVPGEDSLICASKVVVVDEVSLIVRSEASLILPPRKENALLEAVWTRWLQVSICAKKMLRSLLFRAEDCQPEHEANCPELEFDPQPLELSVQHWKGLSEIELLNTRKEVLLHLQEQRASGIIENTGPPSPDSHLIFIRDEHYLECWQEGLRVLNEVIHRNSNDSYSHTHVGVRGGIHFLLGDYESALQDYDLALLNTGGHQSTILLERALVKCMLRRYSEAMQDVIAVITLNPNVNDVQELKACIQQILDQQRVSQVVIASGSSCQQPLLPDQEKAVVKIPDLLTGDEWHSGEIGSQIPAISDAGTAGESLGVARAADWSVTSIAEALKLQLKLTNYSQSLEMNPRYHVRRISFVTTVLEDECDPDDDLNSLSLEDQELLNWQARPEDLQDDLKVRNDLSCLSGRLCPYKNSLLSLCDNVTVDDGHEQRRGPHPLSCYRHISYRSAMLTKHSAADGDGDVQTLFSYDGTAGDRSCLSWRSHDYIKLVLPETRSPYRAFWLVQWDVVDMRHVVMGDPDRGLRSNPEAVEREDDLRKLHSVRWFGEVTGAGTSSPTSDGNGLNRHRGSDSKTTNPRMNILVNEKSQTWRQPQPLRAPGVDRLFPTISENSESGGDSTADSSSVNACPNAKKQGTCTPPRQELYADTKNATGGHTVWQISTQQTGKQIEQPILSDRGQVRGMRLPLARENEKKSPSSPRELLISNNIDPAGEFKVTLDERKSVDNLHYHNGDEKAVSKVLRSADAHQISDNPRELPGLAHCGEEELTSWYQFHCLQQEHTTPHDDKGSTLQEWNQKNESQELKIENGLQVAVKRGSYHDLSRSTIEQVDVRAGIMHPNICKPLHQIFRTGTVPAMELMKHDLRSIIDSRLKGLPEGSTPFTYPVAVDIMLQIAVSMLQCPKDVVHCDLKAKNILLTPLPLAESGSAFRGPDHYYSVIVKLGDFGRVNSRIQYLHGETRTAGTSLYRAPEMLEVREFPLKIDVYSFGMVCYEILTGKLPFEEYRNQGLSLQAGRPLDNVILRDVPEALKHLIHQCLDSNPDLRPTFNHIVMKLRAIPGRKAWDCNTSVHQSCVSLAKREAAHG